MTDLAWLTRRPIAHRGFHDLNRSRWENTLPAFEAAAERGYAIECDLHLSADGIPVVFHDHALHRLCGRGGFIFDLPAAEISHLRIGTTQDHPPTLAELLDCVDGRVPLVIELKGMPGRDDELVAATGKALSGYRGEAAIMSFAHHLVRRFAANAPGIPYGLTAEQVSVPALEAHFSMLAHAVSFVSFNVLELPNPFVTFVRERLAMPVISWTVDRPELAELSARHADQMTFEGFEPQATTLA